MMSISSNRRQFLTTAASAAAFAGTAQLGFLSKLPPGFGRGSQIESAMSSSSPTISSRWCACWKKRRAKSCWRKSPVEFARGPAIAKSSRRCCWPASRTCSRGRASASSSTRCWWSTRPIWRAFRRPTSSAGCRSSGRSTISSRRRLRTKKKATGRWRRSMRAACPPPHKARQAFIDAMDRWDEAAADAAVAGLARTAGANELFDIFARYGCRDFRSIGHKAIYVANAWRTLNTVGWQYAEPVLRSLAYALLAREGARATRPTAISTPIVRAAKTPRSPKNSAAIGKSARSIRTPRTTCSRRSTAATPTALQSNRRDDQPRRLAAIGVGCAARRLGRAADAAARHRRHSHADQHQRPAVRLRRVRQRRDSQAAAAAKRARS